MNRQIRHLCPNRECEAGRVRYFGTTNCYGDDPDDDYQCPTCNGRGWVSHAEYVTILRNAEREMVLDASAEAPF